MSITSGKNGKVFAGGIELADVRDWTITQQADLKGYNSSTTAGHTRRVVGSDDWHASFHLFSATGRAPFSAGDQVNVVFVVDAALQPAPSYAGAGLVESIRPTVNIETGDIVGVLVNVAGQGALTAPA